MKMLKKEILHSTTEYDVLEHKKEVQTMDDRQLVDHRQELIESKAGKKGMSSDEYWSRMWTINAEMASRFCRRIGK